MSRIFGNKKTLLAGPLLLARRAPYGILRP